LKPTPDTISTIKTISALAGVAIFLFLFSSCEKEKPRTQYFAIDSLVNAQIDYFKNVPATLTKISRLDGRVDSTVLTITDSASWSRELDVFRNLNDINKPIHKGDFTVQQDYQSNLNVKAFIGKKKQGVEYLKLYYQTPFSRLRKIDAAFREESMLYKSAKILSMEFKDVNHKLILTSYTIRGGQKMLMGDTVIFSIVGKIRINQH
jgi:hypothetical protein